MERSLIHAITPGDHFSPLTGSAIPTVVHGLAGAALQGLLRYGWLGADTRIVVELAATDDLELPGGYLVERERRYGSTKFLFLRLSE